MSGLPFHSHLLFTSLKLMSNAIKITILGAAFWLFPLLFFGQVMLERQVVASAGDYDELSNDVNISYTVGEMAVTTRRQGTYVYTEGFQQPEGKLLPVLGVSLDITEAQCPEVHDGSIVVGPSGCLPPYSIEMTGNGDTIILTGLTAPHTFSGLDSGDYRITVRGLTLCSVRRDIRLDLKNEDCGVKYYSGITPNGDGQNDFWIIDNIEINQPNEVKIFNRWGNLVWSASNYNNTTVRWEGNNDNENPLPGTTYFFSIEVPGNTSASKSGWIQLLR